MHTGATVNHDAYPPPCIQNTTGILAWALTSPETKTLNGVKKLKRVEFYTAKREKGMKWAHFKKRQSSVCEDCLLVSFAPAPKDERDERLMVWFPRKGLEALAPLPAWKHWLGGVFAGCIPWELIFKGGAGAWNLRFPRQGVISK